MSGSSIEFLGTMSFVFSLIFPVGHMYLAKVDSLDTFTTQGRSDGRRGRCTASTNYELDHLVCRSHLS